MSLYWKPRTLRELRSWLKNRWSNRNWSKFPKKVCWAIFYKTMDEYHKTERDVYGKMDVVDIGK